MNKPTMEEVKTNYYNLYQHSKGSIYTRKAALKRFFEEYGYDKHIFEITTRDLKLYHVWLKNLDTKSIKTRKTNWALLISFIQSTIEDYWDEYGFYVAIPKKTINWHGAIPKNGVKPKKTYATIEEIEKILNFLKERNFKHYLIFRTFVETGIRKGTLIKLKYYEVFPDECYINPHQGKTDEKYFVFSDMLGKLYKIFLKERMKIESKYDNFFLSNQLKQYGHASLNEILNNVLLHLNIKKRITPQTFRRTLNDLRKTTGCDLDRRKELLGHTNNDVNIKSYTRADIMRLRKLYNKWNPYINANF